MPCLYLGILYGMINIGRFYDHMFFSLTMLQCPQWPRCVCTDKWLVSLSSPDLTWLLPCVTVLHPANVNKWISSLNYFINFLSYFDSIAMLLVIRYFVVKIFLSVEHVEKPPTLIQIHLWGRGLRCPFKYVLSSLFHIQNDWTNSSPITNDLKLVMYSGKFVL